MPVLPASQNTIPQSIARCRAALPDDNELCARLAFYHAKPPAHVCREAPADYQEACAWGYGMNRLVEWPVLKLRDRFFAPKVSSNTV